jgi:hypothetical protein
MYFKGAFPVIELNGQCLYDSDKWAGQIAFQYREQLLQKCITLLTDAKILQALSLQDVQLERGIKSSLSLQFKTTAKLQPQEVLEHLGYPHQ